MTRIDALAPRMIPVANAFVAALFARGIPFRVTSTLRTEDEQVALFAQGRMPLAEVNRLRHIAKMGTLDDRDNHYTVTGCDGVVRKSNHQSGMALDLVPANSGGSPLWPVGSDPRWLVLGEIGESCGLSWGGRWKDHPDHPHYELL